MEISISELEQVRSEYAELGKTLERERIIKLLEAEVEKCSCGFFDCSLDSMDFAIERAIALIKGESQERTETGTELAEGENK